MDMDQMGHSDIGASDDNGAISNVFAAIVPAVVVM